MNRNGMSRNAMDRSITRRDALTAAGACFAMLNRRALAVAPATGLNAASTKESEAEGMVEVTGIHDGKGKGRIKLFRFAGASAPAYFIVYDLPPGASEGVHTHFLDDRNKLGSYDEYYYFISGQGQMQVDGRIVAVAQGDHVHTPLEVPHGVENTHPSENLRVFLTFIQRGNEPPWVRAAPQASAAGGERS